MKKKSLIFAVIGIAAFIVAMYFVYLETKESLEPEPDESEQDEPQPEPKPKKKKSVLIPEENEKPAEPAANETNQ
jgi:cell division protein FtsN